MKMARMKVDTYATSRPENTSAGIRRVVVAVVCVGLFVIFGIALPYKIYNYFKARQDAAAVSVLHEEL
jgi:hypothetical protein